MGYAWVAGLPHGSPRAGHQWSPGIGKIVKSLYKLAAKHVISSTKIRPWPGRVRLPDRDNQ